MEENREPGSIYLSMERHSIANQRAQSRNEDGTTVYTYIKRNKIPTSRYEQ